MKILEKKICSRLGDGSLEINININKDTDIYRDAELIQEVFDDAYISPRTITRLFSTSYSFSHFQSLTSTLSKALKTLQCFQEFIDNERLVSLITPEVWKLQGCMLVPSCDKKVSITYNSVDSKKEKALLKAGTWIILPKMPIENSEGVSWENKLNAMITDEHKFILCS